MLSFTKGKDIATFTEGKDKGKVIKLFADNDFSTMKSMESDITIPDNERSQLLTKQFYKEYGITLKQKRRFNAIIDGTIKVDDMSEELEEQIEEANRFINKELMTKLYFDDKLTKIFPLPQKFSERIYVPAPSGSGKSTFIGMYLDFLKKKFGRRTIYIFSRVEEDKPLDRHKNVVRIPLDEEYFKEHPLEIEEFKKGILIFDDIDTIINKSLVKYIRNFRDDVLETGRHYDISVISTSHLIANFLATRTLINEANAIVLFPKGSSFYSVSTFLERYMGFTREQIKYVESLPTRWIWFWKEYPKYAIHEKGVFVF